MENAGDNANNSSGDVVSHDPARIEGVKAFRSPGRLNGFEMTCDPIRIRDPHTRAKHTSEVEGTKAEATEACKQKVDAEDFGEVQGRLSGARILPDLEIPVGPVPDGRKHQQTTENDVRSSNTFEAPEAWINTGGPGDAPATPAVRHAQAGHEGHHEHALTPHGVQDWIGRVEDGEFIKSHRAGPAGNEGCVHEVHGQQSAGVVDDDRVHPIPGQSHGSGSGERSCQCSQTRGS